jgi:hypothetical protein
MSDEARDRWKRFADHHGVSVSALLEAMAEALPHPPESPELIAVIEEARAIDVERRRRG